MNPTMTPNVDEVVVLEEARLARGTRSEELARWLREAGHRTNLPPRIAGGESKVHPPVYGTSVTDPVRLVRLSVFGLLAVSYLQYFYFDALLQVYSLHSLIVFILVNGHA